MINCSDTSILSTLLGPDTKVRELDIEIKGGYDSKDDIINRDFFAKRGNIRTLETLSCPSIGSLAFLRANPQLSKLKIEQPLFPDSPIVPLLAESFKNLSSLSLAWKVDYIPNDALEQISTLHGLSQLRLSAGEQFGWRHNWFVDHEGIRSHLSKLRNLRNLAFCRDTYRNTTFIDRKQSYYDDEWLEPRDGEEQAIFDTAFSQTYSDAEIDYTGQNAATRRRFKAAFFSLHSWRMTKEALEYCVVLPSLSWVYIGKLPLAIEREQSGVRAVALTDELDECWTFLHRMFGLPDSGN